MNKFVLYFCGAFLALALMTKCTKRTVEVIQTPAPVVQPVTPDTKSCTDYSWKDRGRPPMGYYKGVVAVYQKAMCKTTAAKDAVSSSKDKNGNYTDALKQYGISDGDVLRKTYTLLLGLGLRESTGNFTLGRDYSAKGPQSSSSAEVGAWQFSYDAFNSHPELKQIYAYYLNHQNECMVNVFMEGICDPKKEDCSKKGHKVRYDGYIEGGVAYEFQKFFRACPAAQTEYASIMIRKNARHFGPLNRKEAEYRASCEQMFKDAENGVTCK